MAYLIIEIIICFFAAVGAAYITIFAFDHYTSKKTGIRAKLVITDIKDSQNGEYALRILESLLKHSPMNVIIDGITISGNVPIDENTIEKIAREYKNLGKED